MISAAISAVVFDVDDTLVDLQPAIRVAQEKVLAEIRTLSPDAGELTIADMEEDAAAAFARWREAPVEVARREALAASLARVGLAHEADRITERFLAYRFEATEFFDGARELLAELRRDYRVGLGTNGNNHAARLGLTGAVDFAVYACVNGLPKKPARAFFDAVVAAAGTPPGGIVYVGDDWVNDVVGGSAAGLATVWLNRAGAPRPLGADILPDAEIRSLAELPAALTALATPMIAPI